SYSESDSCAGQVPANGTCLLHVKFTPQSVTFPVNATLTVNLADGAQYVVGLTGTGTGPVIAITGNNPVNFGAQVVGTTSGGAITLFVINNGDAPLLISGISITGDFTQTNNCPASLVSTCSINLKFVPTAAGFRSGMLSIADNGFSSPQQISLTGTGTDFNFTPGGTTQVKVIAGQTATFNLSATAVSGFSGQLSLACTGAPTGAACSLSTPNLNVIGNVPVPLTVTVTTSPHTSAAGHSPRNGLWAVNLASIVACVPLAFFLRKRRARVRMAAVCAVLGVVILWSLTGCGGGGGGTTPPPPTPTPPLTTGGTPAGTYTITVTATDQTGSGPVVHQVPLTLVVQ
ncbi:MAG TPA: choice-of-anchor D domain-containing protein, partial [Alphaproteobacteria bacterium]|nr:choice-of-anchor D domain-containing protein [Alphaproteobacteria bacterium]